MKKKFENWNIKKMAIKTEEHNIDCIKIYSRPKKYIEAKTIKNGKVFENI